jgi:MFS family permease
MSTVTSSMRTSPRRQLLLVSLVQVLALSLWFSASAVAPALRAEWGLGTAGGIWLTAIVQVGFAAGAVVSATLNLADRLRPPLLVAASSTLGAGATVAVALWSQGPASAVPLRFLVGFALAGVYPVGMKIVVSWFPRARGVALGVLIGALTLGSALPQLLVVVGPPAWVGVLLAAAALAVLGAVVSVAFIRTGPDARPSPPVQPRYRVAGQCAAVHGGGEGPRGEARQGPSRPPRAGDRPAGAHGRPRR